MIKKVKSGVGTVHNVIGIYKNSKEVIKVYHGTDLVYLKITYTWLYRVIIDSATYTDVGANGSTTANPTITAHMELRQAFSNGTYGLWSTVSGGTVTITYAGSSASNGGTLNTTTGKVTANGRGTTTGDRRKVITVTVTATGDNSAHPTATTTIDVYLQANNMTITSYGAITLSGNFTASGGTVTASATNLVSYTSGNSGTASANCVVTSSGVYNKFTVSGASVTHRHMGTNEVTDTYTLTVTNGTLSKSLNYSITNSKTLSYSTNPSTCEYPTISETSNTISELGGSAVLAVTVYNPYEGIYNYTSGSYEYTGTYQYVQDSTSYQIISSSGTWSVSQSGANYTITHSAITSSVPYGLASITEQINLRFVNRGRTCSTYTDYSLTAVKYGEYHTYIHSSTSNVTKVLLLDRAMPDLFNVTESGLSIYVLTADILTKGYIPVHTVDNEHPGNLVNISTLSNIHLVSIPTNSSAPPVYLGYFSWKPGLHQHVYVNLSGNNFNVTVLYTSSS